MDKTLDVVALGEGMLEFNQTEAGRPEYLQGFGGDTSNVVIAAARAGAHTAYLSRVGSDPFGTRLLELWAHEGVDTRGVERDSLAPTGLYFVTHGPKGHDFSYYRAESAASRMTPDWLRAGPAAQMIVSAQFLHVSGISLAISESARATVHAAMQLAREAGTRVAFDVNLRLRLWSLDQARRAIEAAIACCDIFLPSLEDITPLTGLSDPEAIADWGHALGARQIVLKLGRHGVLTSTDGERHRLPGLQVPLLDATGAGDCFCGNLLAQLSAGASLLEAARYANAAAALAVQGYGAVAPLPRPAQVRAMLARLAGS